MNHDGGLQYFQTRKVSMNAKDEFLEHVKGKIVKCAKITFGDEHWVDSAECVKNCYLKVGHSKSDFETFLNSIDEDYDSGYGTQELFGYIWYLDGTWSERSEYDGAECWEYKCTPEIPIELIGD